MARTGASASVEWPARVEHGAILILEGESSLADLFGFRRGSADPVRVQSLTDVHRPALSVVWEKGLELPVFSVPENAQIFARERWTGAPLIAGVKRGAGAVLWVAAPPGERGHERFPYLLNALADLGLAPPFRSNRLWAFFDSAYRTRVDVDYFAARWRKAGIAALHVAAWHNFEPDPEGDAYLKRLIEACHREGILVYAWFELPHVSEKFWTDHPAWREQTAMQQDAQLDWRKLMNLTNRDCFQRGQRRSTRDHRPLRLGRRESGGAVFRIARRNRQPEPLHADECRRARAVPPGVRFRSPGVIRRPHGRRVAPEVPGFPRRTRTTHAGRVDWRSAESRGAPGRNWTWC